ncbi:LPS-assembly protein LptD [Breznakiella homolactica]|uniref:LPS-assembly protein LptD n=1 Tax=Breznakiella homolactica TaxID=2798577 RepID=A0A7T7XKW3_9SPIR|nr:LPS-assembly protein LptD [Breznakiella homolactica]QQO08294.1 LPS-assembly protein LptD [Breznakiella homolactica]
MKKGFPGQWNVSRFFLMIFFSANVLSGFAQEQTPDGGVPDASVTGEAVPAADTDSDGAAEPEADDAGETEEIVEAEEALSPEMSVILMDINTSTLAELADWARSLGLSEGGTRDDLAARLRSHFGLTEGRGSSDPSARIITIESARTTEYFTLEVVDEEYARLTGDVTISLKEGDDIHRITAWEILYNRTRNTLSAWGGVEYRKEGGDTIETFRGESLTINLDDWAGTFMDGLSERSLSGEETTYRFEGEVISRTGDDVTVLRKATISNPKNEENYWSIKASKIWLLPGSDWAIFNAVLKVGEIPVLYIPFFFLPADEIIFHPVIGYRSREGSYLQTTTYILGRPKADASSENSITKILGNATDMERVREGIFLRSTGKKDRSPNDTRLSLLFDAYANLGAYIGTELELPKLGILDSTTLSFGIGFTRDIYQLSDGSYSPYYPDFDGESSWNKSRLFSMEVPFRYRLKTTGALSGKAGRLSWDLPFYSDPFVERDFMDRSEAMDWFNLAMNSSSSDDDTSDNILGSYEWRVSATSSPSFPSLNPYITSLTLSNLSTFLSYKTRNSSSSQSSYTPSSTFFFPDKWTIYSLSGSVAGQPLSYGNSASAPGTGETPENRDDPMRQFGIPRPPWETHDPSAGEESTGTVDSLVPPSLSQSFTIPTALSGPVVTFDYRLNPTASSEMQFRSSYANWPDSQDVSWDEISSILTSARLNGSATVNVKDNTGLYAASLALTGTGAWQGYNYVNEDSEDFDTQAKLDASKVRNHNATYFNTYSEFTTTLRPFFFNSIWSNTSFSYSIKNLLAKSVFDGTADDPSWEILFSEWNKDAIESHKVTANINALVLDKQQNVTLTADIPPRDSQLTGNASFRVWRTTTTVSTSVKELANDPEFQPVTFTETLDLGPSSDLRYSMVYDPEEDELTSISTSLNFRRGGGAFSAAFSTAYGVPYVYDDTSGWQTDPSGDTVMHPKDIRLSYNHSFKNDTLFNKRFGYSLDVGSSLTLDLQRYTYSSFTFTLGSTVRITDFLDLSFSATSMNSVIFRYMQDLPFFDIPVDLPGERNVIKDLVNSFRFDDESLRRGSGFKLKDLSLAATHYLGDWNAKLEVKLAPYLDQSSTPYKYRFNTEISFLIQWIPVSEFKSEIKYDKDVFEFL